LAILLLFGGAIQLAGEDKARGDRRRARSDWMALERGRGISVSSAMMSFEHEGLAFNLLDKRATRISTQWISAGTAALSAVDSAVMVLDATTKSTEGASSSRPKTLRGVAAARGADPKLFGGCGLREVPIFTFLNKLGHKGRDPFDLSDKIEQLSRLA
jgi:peptide chain release factor 3